MSQYTIEAITWSPDGVRVSFMNGASDVRAEGGIYQAHTICVSWTDDEMTEAFRALEEAAEEFLAAAITRWAQTMPVDLEQQRRDALAAALDDDDEDGDD